MGTGTRLINFGDGVYNTTTYYQFGASQSRYNGSPGVSSGTQMKSCSNVSCHFKDSPGWMDPADAGD